MQRSFSLLLWLMVVFLPGAAIGQEGTNRGKGFVDFGSLADSPDQAFVRAYVELDPLYAESQDFSPWSIEDLRVGYHDLNDDGVPELFISFAEVSSAHCGTGGCDMIVFEKRDGHWRELSGGSTFSVWVSDEENKGYRTLYLSDGWKLQWSDKGYEVSCPKILPTEIRTEHESKCLKEQ